VSYHFGGGRSRAAPYVYLAPALFLYILFSLGPSLATAVFSLTDATGLPACQSTGWASRTTTIPVLGAASQENWARSSGHSCSRSWLARSSSPRAVRGGHPEPEAAGHQVLPDDHLPARDPGRDDPGPHVDALPLPAWRPDGQPLRPFRDPARVPGRSVHGAIHVGRIVQIWANLGITMVIFLAGLATIPTEVYEAARSMGRPMAGLP